MLLSTQPTAGSAQVQDLDAALCSSDRAHAEPHAPVLRSGNTNTVALPATSLAPLTLTCATVGSMAASYWMGPSTCGTVRRQYGAVSRGSAALCGQ
jgi:hypothetical protein